MARTIIVCSPFRSKHVTYPGTSQIKKYQIIEIALEYSLLQTRLVLLTSTIM